MSHIGRVRPPRLVDSLWQLAYRFGFPIVRAWRRVWCPRHEGALVAVYVDQALLLVRSSYRTVWNFPGGGIRRDETPEAAARRELLEEIGLRPSALLAAGSAFGSWDGRRHTVHFFELRLDGLPDLQLDNREIIAAQFVSPDALKRMALTGPVAAYLRRSPAPVAEG